MKLLKILGLVSLFILVFELSVKELNSEKESIKSHCSNCLYDKRIDIKKG